MSRKARGGKRKIHIDLSEETHRKLRVKAALEDTSMQAFVAALIEEAVGGVAIPKTQSRRK